VVWEKSEPDRVEELNKIAGGAISWVARSLGQDPQSLLILAMLRVRRVDRGPGRGVHPASDSLRTVPSPGVVDDAGEMVAQLDRGRQFAVVLVGSVNRGGDFLGDDEHGRQNGGRAPRRASGGHA
jgi:hypothetical protein